MSDVLTQVVVTRPLEILSPRWPLHILAPIQPPACPKKRANRLPRTRRTNTEETGYYGGKSFPFRLILRIAG